MYFCAVKAQLFYLQILQYTINAIIYISKVLCSKLFLSFSKM